MSGTCGPSSAPTRDTNQGEPNQARIQATKGDRHERHQHHPAELAELCKSGKKIDLIDVRTPVEFREVHVEIARNVPLDQLDPAAVMQARNGSADEPLYVICRSGSRGQQACEKFLGRGLRERRQRRGRHAGLRGSRPAGRPRQEGDLAGAAGAHRGGIAGAAGRRCSAGSSIRPSSACRPSSGPGWSSPAITDTCGMGMMLARMPWNQVKDDVRRTCCAHEGGLLMKLLIVGGVAGGASAAARARRLSEDAQIVLFERGPDVSFANCGLPYYVGGEIAERDKLLVVTPELLRTRFKLDVRTRSSVEAIDRAAKKVRVRDLASGREYEETYDKLILAPGAAPLRPPIPGIDLPGVFTLRNLQDVDRIKERMDQGVKQAVVVGAGFIGLELVENFVRRGIATTVVELQDQVLPPFDKEMTTPIARGVGEQGRHVAARPVRRGVRAGARRPGRPVEVGPTAAGSTGRPGRRRAAGEQAGGRCGPGSRASWRHPGQRAPANQRPGHLCGRRRHRGQGLRDRRADAGAAGRTGQPPGPDRRRQHLRPGGPLSRNAGHGHRAASSTGRRR